MPKRKPNEGADKSSYLHHRSREEHDRHVRDVLLKLWRSLDERNRWAEIENGQLTILFRNQNIEHIFEGLQRAWENRENFVADFEDAGYNLPRRRWRLITRDVD